MWFFKKVPNVEVSELPNAIADENTVIVDIRPSYKFRLRRIKNSHQFSEINDSSFVDKKVIIVCNQGIGAKMVAKKLAKKGVNAQVLKGGMNAVTDESVITKE